MHLEFTVPGKPVAWSVKLGRGRIYPTAAARTWQGSVQAHALLPRLLEAQAGSDTRGTRPRVAAARPTHGGPR